MMRIGAPLANVPSAADTPDAVAMSTLPAISAYANAVRLMRSSRDCDCRECTRKSRSVRNRDASACAVGQKPGHSEIEAAASASYIGKSEEPMSRLSATTLVLFIGLQAPALAQMTTVPGPGGVPLAPGLPVPGYTPGGIGPGGVEVAPGAAARDVPMYRIGPGGILFSPRPDPRAEPSIANAPLPTCPNGVPCLGEILPHTLVLTINSRDAGPPKAPAPDAAI